MSVPLHIGIVGPVATADVAHLLGPQATSLPPGMPGAPILATLIAELLRRGHRVSAFTLSSDMPLREDAAVVARGPAFELHLAPARPRAWPMNGHRLGRIVDLYSFERNALRRAILSSSPDVLHAHWAYEYAWAALRAGLPHVVTCHDSPFLVARFQRDFVHGAYRWLRAGIAWHVLRQARRVTTVSPYMVGQVQRLCRVPVGVVPNPMPMPMTGIERANERSGTTPRVVMVANGWDARKNPQAAFVAFGSLSRQLPAAELHLYGHGFGPDQAAERWWRGQRLNGNVHFHGPVSHAAILDTFASSHMLLHPALEESFGAVLAEAMTMGLPVVAGAHSGAVPWVVGKGGLLVDVTDPVVMADAMYRVATEPGLASELARCGQRDALARFGVSTVAAAYEREYAAALSTVISAREACA